MKIAKRDLKLLLILAGLLVFLLLYMLVFNPLQTKIDAVEARNAQLSAQVEDLEAKYLRMAEYEDGIKNYLDGYLPYDEFIEYWKTI